ncbi:MAG: hypothetical protein ACRD8A_20180 [Candidatus Acidiferrales bacterium]
MASVEPPTSDSNEQALPVVHQAAENQIYTFAQAIIERWANLPPAGGLLARGNYSDRSGKR